jgi:hypothetical protein
MLVTGEEYEAKINSKPAFTEFGCLILSPLDIDRDRISFKEVITKTSKSRETETKTKTTRESVIRRPISVVSSS